MISRKRLTCLMSDFYGVANRGARRNKGIRILMYHALDARPDGDTRGLFCLSPDQFKFQITELAADRDLRKLGLYDVFDPTKQKGIIVTFDDGYRDNILIAAPILEKYHIPFTMFISTAFVKDRVHLYLSPEELRELSNSPLVTIGSHGVTHIPLTQCNDHDLHSELNSSKRYLEDLTGREITAISYPHGAVDRRVRDAAENVGYELGASSYFGFNDASTDLLTLRRICILSNDSHRVFEQKIKGDWDWYYWWQRIQDRGRWG
jgi:peptidoglycan/xylan/chitin deacetylase (PgdA/CDA1 family)